MFCNRHIFHHWSKWSAGQKATVTYQDWRDVDGKKLQVTLYIQERRCERCGKEQFRKVKP